MAETGLHSSFALCVWKANTNLHQSQAALEIEDVAKDGKACSVLKRTSTWLTLLILWYAQNK